MRDLPNIEKSGFRHGQYVGYSAGKVWRIVRARPGWLARCTTPKAGADVLNRFDIMRADTLEEMSGKLTALETVQT